jgi:tetratricopeptide (TPR) repeat protein
LQSSLINPLIATKGYSAPEVERACGRARDLCREIGDPPQLFTVFGGLFSVYHNRGEFRAASEMAERMLRLAKIIGDPRLLMWSHHSLGMNSEIQGLLPTARIHFEESLALYDLRQRGSYGYVQDPYVTGLGWLAHILHSLGYIDQALAKSEKALSDAREGGTPYNLAWALGSTAALRIRRGEYLQGRELATERSGLCTEYGFASLAVQCHLWYGWTLVQEGQKEEGIERIQYSLATSSYALQSRHIEFYLARAYRQVGRVEEGLSIVENAIAKMNSEGELRNLPELFRLKGELLMMLNSREIEAEQYVHRAIEMACRSGDKITELVATTSLARLLSKQGHLGEGHAMLADVYNWFTEGFDTADLKEAKTLLDELAR